MMARVIMTGLAGLCLHFMLAPAVVAETLLETRTSWDDGALAYPEGEVEITSFILRLEEGDEPKFHCHPVPTMGYVLKGSVRVETRDGRTATFHAGQSVVEVMRTVHRGTAVGGPVEIIVFFAGSVDVPNTVFAGTEAATEHCVS